ncbi:MAG: response regulator [Myxococcaceae bacterium]|nr:response regulator [Myxococcaceae bacterium]MCA3011486.1 response regulator [Myxococcaceae bacterium]
MTRRYLLIDDNEAFAENLAEILRDTGAEVDVVHDGPAALAAVGGTRYDALVTDMRMPGMSGAEALHEIRRVDPGVPAVLLSAYSHDEHLRMARRDGLLAVLSKLEQLPRLLKILTAARRDGAVLLIEDDVALADNLTEALCERGLTAVSVTRLRDLGAIAARPFAALVDLKLPDARFGEALAAVTARWPDTPAIVMTAFAHDAPGLGGAECVQKPFDTAALLARLETFYREQKPA